MPSHDSCTIYNGNADTIAAVAYCSRRKMATTVHVSSDSYQDEHDASAITANCPTDGIVFGCYCHSATSVCGSTVFPPTNSACTMAATQSTSTTRDGIKVYAVCEQDLINLNFGGTRSGEGHFAKALNVEVRARPDQMKSLECTDTECTECTDIDSCWHGTQEAHQSDTVPWTKKQLDGYMAIHVPPNHPGGYSSYVAEMWARCASGGGEWSVKVYDISNGILNVYLNDELLATAEEVTWPRGNSQAISFSLKGDARIRLIFRPTNSSELSKAVTITEGWDIDPWVDECMTNKDCLNVLNPNWGSENMRNAGFALRNSARLQYLCLNENDTSSYHTTPADEMCNRWKNCLSERYKDHLKSILEAASPFAEPPPSPPPTPYPGYGGGPPTPPDG